MPIRNVLLDLDDTILNFRAAERSALAQTLAHFGIEPTEENCCAYSDINKGFWRALERGEITREKLLVARFEALYVRLLGCEREHPSAAATQAFYEQKLSEGHDFMPGAPELLDALVEKYRLFLASNGNINVQTPRIRDAGIAHYFEDIFISEQMGADKPSAAYFDLCFARMRGALREETVIVGDSLTSDILGGNCAGIHTVRYNPCGDLSRMDIIPEFEITSLKDLPDLLEKIP